MISAQPQVASASSPCHLCLPAVLPQLAAPGEPPEGDLVRFPLGLGGSVGTPTDGVTAPVLVVADEDGLKKVADQVRGKIVLFNKVMPPYDTERGAAYGPTVKYRVHGARLAAELGAVAALVRSVTATSLQTPHTGAMRYGDAKVKIPTAAITIEDAELLARLQERGTRTVVNLKMEAKTLPDAESANAVAY